MSRIDYFFPQERKTFTGHWVNGKRTGPGKMIWLNGEEYNGEWLNNLQVNFSLVPYKFQALHSDLDCGIVSKKDFQTSFLWQEHLIA